MKYIDKQKAPVAGNKIVENFLTETQRQGNRPVYHLLTRTPLKKELRDILIDEQEGYCCYCMRKLKKDESTTIEHVIPKSATISEFNTYLSDYPGCFSHITHIDHFVGTWVWPPYPHTVAYYNTLASCKGMLTDNSKSCSCCNNKRVHEQILPLPFVADIESIIQYIPTGQVFASDKDPEKEKALDILNLNCGTIKDIRKLWYLAKKKGVDITNKVDLLKVYNGDFLNIPITLRQYYKNDYYFSIFLDYKWFFQYY